MFFFFFYQRGFFHSFVSDFNSIGTIVNEIVGYLNDSTKMYSCFSHYCWCTLVLPFHNGSIHLRTFTYATEVRIFQTNLSFLLANGESIQFIHRHDPSSGKLLRSTNSNNRSSLHSGERRKCFSSSTRLNTRFSSIFSQCVRTSSPSRQHDSLGSIVQIFDQLNFPNTFLTVRISKAQQQERQRISTKITPWERLISLSSVRLSSLTIKTKLAKNRGLMIVKKWKLRRTTFLRFLQLVSLEFYMDISIADKSND